MKAKKDLTPDAWIKAGFRALTKGGHQAIRAEALARDLKASKGSFYWHFGDVASLQEQMLEQWKAEASEASIAAVESRGGSGADKLRFLVEIVTGDANEPYGGLLVEAAIRDWARYNELAAAMVNEVNILRIEYLETLFRECGADPTVSRTNSIILYSALIGMEALAHAGLADLRKDLRSLLETLLDSA